MLYLINCENTVHALIPAFSVKGIQHSLSLLHLQSDFFFKKLTQFWETFVNASL